MKVYTYKFLVAFNVFQYNDTGMVPNHWASRSSSSSGSSSGSGSTISPSKANSIENSALAKKGK